MSLAHVSESRDFDCWLLSMFRSLGHCGWQEIRFWAKKRCKEIWGLLEWQELGSVCSCLQSPGTCRHTNLWTQKHTESTRKGSRASSGGEGLRVLKVDKTHKCSSPARNMGNGV